jgi:predicted dehydrogenase
MRLGIAGCGRIAERGYIPAALAAEGVTIAAFADPDGERLRQCAEIWKSKCGEEPTVAAGVGALLASTPLDLLVVAAPAEHHLAIAREAAAAGVRSLVEKPPAPDLAEAERLAELDPPPLLAFNRRFLQGTDLRDSIPAEGWLELDLQLQFRREAWGAHQSDDEALLDAGIHLIDLACHLTASPPIAVRRARVTPDQASFELELARARATITCATNRSHNETVTIRDSSGKTLARSAWGGIGARLASLLGRPDPLALSLQRQLEGIGTAAVTPEEPPHLLRRRGHPRRPPIASATDGVTAMAVAEAARRSSSLDGAEVTVRAALGAQS